MKRNILLLIFTPLIVASCASARKANTSYPVLPSEYLNCSGELKSVVYPTSITGPAERRMYVYLPSCYNDSEARFPVVYFLHGARGSESSWITQGNLVRGIDSLMNAGVIKPAIVVFANMNSYDSEQDYAMSRHKGALESFFEVDGSVESSFVKDVVGTTDSIFRTIPEKNARAIAGLSLGGMQAMYISASSPTVFGYVGIFSSPVHSPIRRGPYSDFYDHIDFKIYNQFMNPPAYYGIYVGTHDIYLKTMTRFCRNLNSQGYTCEFNKKKGGHQWPLWTGFALDFMKKLWVRQT